MPHSRSPSLKAARLTALMIAAPAIAAAQSSAPPQRLPEIQVSATPTNPFEGQSAQAVDTLSGTALERSLSTSIGDTVSTLPGIHSSGFGVAAGRPIIRGQDGPRIRVTSNNLETLDASTLSPDHAVTVEPLFAQRIEVLRGPATLLYGSGAIGGLVNVITDQIPRSRIQGVQGFGRASTDSASRGQSVAGGLRLGQGAWQFSVGALQRRAEDYRIPGLATVDDPSSARGRLPNSFARGDALQLGASYVAPKFALGLGYSTNDQRYGIPSESDVFIGLRQRRTEWYSEWLDPVVGIERIQWRGANNRYEHSEIEAPTGQIGTTVSNRGNDQRLEIQHAPWGTVRGAFGVQWRDRTLGATGAEAYIPVTDETNRGFFYAGQMPVGPGRLEFGARNEQARLSPESSLGLEARRFSVNSMSAGLLWPTPAALGLRDVVFAFNAGRSQRAPTVEELYANGPHAATGSFEIGDTSLRREQAEHFDIGLRKAAGTSRWQLSAYTNRFKNYVVGSSTDDNADGIADRVDDQNLIQNDPSNPGAGDFARLRYNQAPARFYGIELQWQWKPTHSPWGLSAFADLARGTISGGGNAPRMSPSRINLSVTYAQGPWSGFISATQVERARRLALLETPTDGYTLLNTEVAYSFKGAQRQLITVYVQGRNLLNETVRLHTSYIKDLVPMPGRSMIVGVRGQF